VEDIKKVNNQIPEIVKEFFPNCSGDDMESPLIFGDFMQAVPDDDEANDPEIYEDLVDFATLSVKCNALLETYNDYHDGQQMNIVLFDACLDHMCRLMRILKFPGGHALLIGYGGSGKQTITKLAAYTAGFEIFSIQLKKVYKKKEFYEDLL
jgi:dynein heavy chain